ncbi:MarR family winged helix-turn-helix transcriptional regulator [Brachybacterium alimentarium]|uniref:MarR family winged helix-turn-helix transcriptional regulator n=1 Tax=Brachybacterium alimentarium TaxID=47845 RepID=UPI0031E07A02
MPDDQNVAHELREALRPLYRRLNNARTMSLGKAGILTLLAERGRATAAQLATAQQITPQGVTSALNELESQQLIERVPDDVDRRRIWVHVTEEGRRRLEDDRAAGQSWLVDALTERLDDEERRIVRAALPVLRKITEDSADA